jgi:hypothetical protein
MQRMILSVHSPRPPGVPPVLRCQHNPEGLTITHAANLVPRPAPIALSATPGNAPLPGHAGPGQTLMNMRLLFESETDPVTGAAHDVRHLTQPLYRLADGPATVAASGQRGPHLVDFIWGKNVSVLGCISRLSEVLDMFDVTGTALRSWITLEVWASAPPRITAFDPAAPDMDGAIRGGQGAA